MAKIEISPGVFIDDNEIELTFVRSPAPGGQNVNKVSSCAQLRFNAATSPSLPEEARKRLITLAGSKATREGVIVISAHRFRSQGQNRRDALDRLGDLISKALIKPKTRRPTKPPASVKRKRLENKRQRSQTKNLRRNIPED